MDETEGDGRSPIIVEDEGLQHGFTQIPNLILRNHRISPGAKLTYAVLLSYAWTDDHCFPGQERMAYDLAVTDRSVRTYLQQLQDAGLISVQQRGLGKTNVYIIHRLRPENISGQERKETTGQDRKNLPPTNTQQKKTQGKKSFEASKAPPVFPHVDNPEPDTAPGDGAPDRYRRKRADLPAHAMIPITRLIEDLSRDLDDQDHLQSNISRAANLYEQYADDVDSFFVRAYEARTFARHQVNARSRMALFFAALERELKA